jgi:hypothetical protein
MAKVAQLARDMAVGYTAHITASRMAPRIDSKALVKLIADYPTDSVPRKNGPPFTFDTQDTFYNALVRDTIREEFPRIWLTGSLLAVGDALKDNGYFDRAPELELVRHLRNGVAHGNRFEIRYPDELTEYPAHNRACYSYSIFEITPAHDGQPVLFDFMEAGDVLDLLFSVASHLDELKRRASPQPVVATEAERLRLIELFEKSQKQSPESSQPAALSEVEILTSILTLFRVNCAHFLTT